MGQDITLTPIESGNDSVHIYFINRSISGMEVLYYSDLDREFDPNNTADVMARKLLELGVEAVSIYSSVITIQCEPEVYNGIEDQVKEKISYLMRYYGDKSGWARYSIKI